MATFGIIVLFLLCGVILSLLAYFMDMPMKYEDMKFLFPICATLFSFNFAACSACCTALLKYREKHEECDVSPIVKEMKDSIIAMAIGIFVVLLSLFGLNFCSKLHGCNFFIIIIGLNGIIYGVFVMYIFLVSDIAISFLELIRN